MKEVLQRDVKNFQRAVDVATLSDYTTRVGCVAAINNRFLCGTFNTHRNAARNVPHKEATRHAEPNCLAMVSDSDYSKLTLHVARINKIGGTLPSRPCTACMTLIVSLGVREVVYINKSGRLVKEYW
jgi:tRNA(Arg) A34 adenosine deaminase TadA